MDANRPCIDRIEAVAYTIPTDQPEADGTLEWNATTLVLVTVRGGGERGIGYTYAHAGAAAVVNDSLRSCVVGHDAMDIPLLWKAMVRSLRNVGCPGIGLMAVAAVDHALWDLKGRLLDRAVVDLLGAARAEVPIYGSGGFTSYTTEQLQRQLSSWVGQGIGRVKMKVGAEPSVDPERVRQAREAIGSDVSLMVDANGALTRKQALQASETFAAFGVCWFEEPVSSDDLEGLAWIRDRAPAGMDVTAGEYGWDDRYFRRMLQAGAVDVLQIDATRCGGFTGFLQAAAVADSFELPVSAHCAPHLHAHVCSAVQRLAHVEYFHDHVRIEQTFFDGLPMLRDGCLVVDRGRPGLGFSLKESDVERFRLS